MVSHLELRTRVVGPYSMNSYAFVNPETGDSVLIDPGAEPDTLMEMLKDTNPVGILLTHTHADHVGALAEMRARLQVPLMLHPGPHVEELEWDADRWVQDGDTVQLGDRSLRIIHVPGHTEDQIWIAPEGDTRVIVGDSIFEGGPGKTWAPEQFQLTLKSLRDIILHFPDDTVCYPGHGPAFRLGERKQAIQAFLSKDHGAFFGDATWEM